MAVDGASPLDGGGGERDAPEFGAVADAEGGEVEDESDRIEEGESEEGEQEEERDPEQDPCAAVDAGWAPVGGAFLIAEGGMELS